MRPEAPPSFREREGLVCDGRRWTFREFNSRLNRLANLLLNHNVQKGEQLANLFLNSTEVIAHCEGKIASFKKPRSVSFLEALPRNAAGKALKRNLVSPADPDPP